MAFRSNQYFNNPAFAQAAANLQSLFAPPSGGDAAGWALANARRDEAGRLSELFDLAKDPNFNRQLFDRVGVAAGAFNPNQSYYSVDTADATARRGQDVTAATSRANNAADNQRAIQTNALDNQRSLTADMFGPLNPGQVRPPLPESVADIFNMPALDAESGAPKPLSETELKAVILGSLPPDERRAVVLGDAPVENIVTPEGPRTVFRPDAVGEEPHFNKGAESKPTNGTAVINGVRVAVTQRGDGIWRTQDGTPIPPQTEVFAMARPTGTAEDVGLTRATDTMIQKRLIAIDQTKGTAQALRELIGRSPSSQGLVGALRGTAQDVIQTGTELGQFFGGGVAEVNDAVRDGLLDAGVASELFDPNIPAIDMLTNLLSWQYAKTFSGDRVSNEQLLRAREAIGGTGIFANTANTLTRLDKLIDALDHQRSQLGPLSPGLQLGETPAPGVTNRITVDGYTIEQVD